MPRSEITLFTSLPPRVRRPVQGCDFGPAWQTACIESWKSAGFRVVSLNGPEELGIVRSLAPGIEFQEVPEGRKRPLITDFLAAAQTSGSKIVGIINADCMIIREFNLAKRLIDHIDGLVVVERFGISPQTLRPTGRDCSGFDAFFFEVAAIGRLKCDDHWHIGGIWWDFWLPLAFHLAGFKIRTLPAPVLLHLDHDLAWNWDAWESGASRLVKLLSAASNSQLEAVLAAKSLKTLSKTEVGEFQHLLFMWLRSQSPLWTPKPDSIDDLMTKLVNASAIFPQPYSYEIPNRLSALRRKVRARLRKLIDMLGLRRTLHTLRIVKRRQIPS